MPAPPDGSSHPLPSTQIHALTPAGTQNHASRQTHAKPMPSDLRAAGPAGARATRRFLSSPVQHKHPCPHTCRHTPPYPSYLRAAGPAGWCPRLPLPSSVAGKERAWMGWREAAAVPAEVPAAVADWDRVRWEAMLGPQGEHASAMLAWSVRRWAGKVGSSSVSE
eukprot:1157468-Pelagomonas_calceolata.AAC.7